jgi:Putative beta-barrel porin-2, OmpL-like. bbp2
MTKRSRLSLVLAAALIASMFGATATSMAQTSPTTDDLQKKIDDLEKQIMDIKAQMAAPAPPPPPAAAPAPAPAPTTIATLLGPTTLSGFVDVYAGGNANTPFFRAAQLNNFNTATGQFGLNMIELIADKAPDATAGRIGYHVSLGFGQAINAVNGTELGFDQYLKEGYIDYAVGKKFTVTVGKFVTPAGAEVIESKDNWNYSRSLLFAWAIPYFHFGANAKYTFNSKFAVTGYLVNGWNNSIDNNTGKTFGASAAWTPNAKWSVIENYLTGPEHTNDNSTFRQLSDTVISYNPTAKLSLMANYDYGRDHFVSCCSAPFFVGPLAKWSGLAGYVKYAPNAKYYIALRGEYFDDNQGFETGTAQELNEFTFTFQRVLAKALMTRLEVRRDNTDSRTFIKDNGTPVASQTTATLGLIYAFSTAPQ